MGDLSEFEVIGGDSEGWSLDGDGEWGINDSGDGVGYSPLCVS